MAKEGAFRIFNTMTKTKEVFKPLVPGKVGMYVCGVTAYNFSHIGHARSAVVFDVLFRYLQHLGYEVTYVRNFTDIDDKIIHQARELKEGTSNHPCLIDHMQQIMDSIKKLISGTKDLKEASLCLSNRFCEEYLADMDSLQCLRPTYQPRVTTHMTQILDMITPIMNNGFAYTVEGDVFFSVDKFSNYGQLSSQKLENNRAGERVTVDLRKSNPADFALWKAAKSGEPRWDSPWGPGRPGWHIECSAMSAHYLTFKFDIHGGGIDLVFPHHENEIAQSHAACKESHVRYWMHNGHVTNNHEKMSKSSGNFFTIREVTELYHPLALRHFLISAHYSSPLNYSAAQLESSSQAIFKIYQTLCDCEAALSVLVDVGLKENGVLQNCNVVRITADAKNCISKLHDEFETKMADDLSTSHILTGAFQEALRLINTCLSDLKKKKQKQQQLTLAASLTEMQKEAKVVLGVLGLLSAHSYSEVVGELKGKALKRAKLTEDDVQQLINERAKARENKDFPKSDRIRADLNTKGIAMMDVGKETTWEPCVPWELP